MVVYITHDECVLAPFEGHSVLAIDIRFENAWSPLYWMAAKPWMSKIYIEKM